MSMRESRRKLPVLAVDLGGTKILAAIVSGSGDVLAEERHPTQADEGPQGVIGRIVSAIDHILTLEKMSLSQLHSISMAAAGAIDVEKGLVTSSPNLPGWHNTPLRDIVKEKFGVNTFILHDANAAALAEQHFGAGKGVKNLIYITVSTGIGGGIIIAGNCTLVPAAVLGRWGI